MNVPFLNLGLLHSEMRSELSDAFERVLNSQHFVLGSEVGAFEREFAQWTTTNYAVGTSNGLDALAMSLKALGVGHGDEVVMPANTYIATALAASQIGAKPVLVDVDEKTALMDSNLLGEAVRQETKVIIPVHLYGQACQMTEITRVARENGSYVLEDNAQAQGATWEGKHTGSMGDVAATSFYPGKNLGALGDAGAVTTNDAMIDTKVREFGNYGSKRKYEHDVKGANMRLDELQAAFLRVKLPKLHGWNDQRRAAASRYDELLGGLGDIQIPTIALGATHVYHLYVIQTSRRDDLAAWLHKKGVVTLVHYPRCIHEHKAYSELEGLKGAFPVAERLAQTSLSLPMHPHLTESEQAYVAECIAAFFSGQA